MSSAIRRAPSPSMAALEAAAGKATVDPYQAGHPADRRGHRFAPLSEATPHCGTRGSGQPEPPRIEQSLPVKLGVFGSIAVAAVGCVTEELRRTAPDVNSKHSNSMSSVCRSMCATPRSTSPWLATERIRRRSHAISASAGTQRPLRVGHQLSYAVDWEGHPHRAAPLEIVSRRPTRPDRRTPQTINGIRCPHI
jgi:hypothetical protein